MTDDSREREARDQEQMKDQGGFREDPRGKQEVAEQQPETQPGGEDAEQGRPKGDGGEQDRGESGRDDGGEATGNPPNAG